MKFTCTIERHSGGGYRARHDSDDLGLVEARGTTREEALHKLRGELRYRLELCPCSGESYQHIEIEVVETPARR
ncbi:MAG: hypothetical protein HYX69_12975 [Planctomycetia bacterium]|nr:hypothetical protein [Planctomycetia bacterium]